MDSDNDEFEEWVWHEVTRTQVRVRQPVHVRSW
jgi:hypothetical protein